MREVKEINQHAWIDTNHNFNNAKCRVTNTGSFHIEQTAAQNKKPEVTHQPLNLLNINSGSHYSSKYHRCVTKHVWSEVTQVEWKDSVWFERCPPKDVENNPIDDWMEEDKDHLHEIHV
ncbi:hypothetical protein DFH28DRAFT_899213 [Melampsora americana]|nr:hypothetical protein DFH28DRAFT_899213 [Melampsora americana]